MKDIMFRRLSASRDQPICFRFDGAEILGRQGDTVAAALLAAGKTALRTTALSGSPRGPFCMMGVCFDCLVTIDGAPNRQACLTPITEGMDVVPQAGSPIVTGDR